MRWTCLGHASWLAEAGGLRILFDPALGERVHGGLHLVHPPREIDVDALRPDLVAVSHVHPDHFDPASLRALAVRHPEVPVASPDPLVLEAARGLGFRHAFALPPGARLDLGAATLLTTPSAAREPEWGCVVADRAGAVWNQVDSVLDAAAVRAVHDRLSAELGRRALDLALVHWCPLQEVEAVLGAATAFPAAAWAEKLAAVAAIEADAVVPAAAGLRHAPPFGWRDAHVFPATTSMLARDLGVMAARARVLPNGPGLAYEVGPGGVSVVAAPDLVTPLPPPPEVPWGPLALPALEDPALGGERAADVLSAVEPWLAGPLAEAVARGAAGLGLARPLRLALELVLPGGDRRAVTYVAGPEGARLAAGVDPDHDARVEVAGSMLADVLAGRRHWGEPLLAGLLRGARRLPVLPALFPYWALSYRASTERWVRAEVARLAGR